MSGLTFSGEVKLDNLSIIISALVFVYTLIENRKLRRREYADKIRRAAGTVISKLERRKELTLRFFQDVQPTITEIDMSLVQSQDLVKARDTLWIGITKTWAVASQRITDEQIEIAYIDLYGYDHRIQNLYISAIDELKLIEAEIHREFLILTQEDVERMKEKSGTMKSGELGNALHGTCELVSSDCVNLMGEVIEIFRLEMLRLIEASDDKIVNRMIDFQKFNYPFSAKNSTTQHYPETVNISANDDKGIHR